MRVVVKQKHILFVSSWYPNRNNTTHGIFNRYFAEAASLHNKISVLHVCSDETVSGIFEHVESEENNIYTLVVYYKKVLSKTPLLSSLKKRKLLLQAFEKGYQRLIKRTGKPDLIQLNVIMPAGIGVQYLSHKYNIPYIINEGWSGYTKEDGNYKGVLLKHFTKKIITNAEVIMPTSEYLKKAMLEHGLKGNYQVVPNVINTNLFKPDEVSDNSEVTSFIHISSLNEREKNVTGILRAFARACKQNNLFKLTIVGDGPELKGLMQLTQGLEIKNNITFKGKLKPEELVKEINRHHALLMFSNYETFSLVIMEGFACGKPVITSNAGAIKDYMEPRLGVMVNKNNKEELLNALLTFSKTNYNKDYIRKFAVDNFSYEKVGKQLNEIYKRILEIES